MSYLSRDGRWPLRSILSDLIYLFKCFKGFKNEEPAHTNAIKASRRRSRKIKAGAEIDSELTWHCCPGHKYWWKQLQFQFQWSALTLSDACVQATQLRSSALVVVLKTGQLSSHCLILIRSSVRRHITRSDLSLSAAGLPWLGDPGDVSGGGCHGWRRRRGGTDTVDSSSAARCPVKEFDRNIL